MEKIMNCFNNLTPDDIEKITHKMFWDRWIEKLHSLSVEQRTTFVDKVIKKYSSDEYVNKEYGLGYEPRTVLYDLIYRYAGRYGKELSEEYYTDFVADAVSFDEIWCVKLLIGQGSIIRVSRIEE